MIIEIVWIDNIRSVIDYTGATGANGAMTAEECFEYVWIWSESIKSLRVLHFVNN